MTASKSRREGIGSLGIGFAACAACCAGPLLALLGGLSLAGLASTLLIGAAGFVAAAIAAVAFVAVRRSRTCAVDDSPTPVTAPVRRAPS